MLNRLVIAGFGAFAMSAHADVINIGGSIGDSTEQTGATFSGTIDYTHNGGSSGTLLIALTNDTSPFVGGFLTGFVFNIDSTDGAAAAALTATDTNFLDTGSENGAPYGTFMAGASLGGNWAGGGNPSNGIGIGATGLFTFAVTASDAGLLSASSFINGPNDFDFVVRFRGLENGGSDKVPVPAPASFAALALGALATGRRRR